MNRTTKQIKMVNVFELENKAKKEMIEFHLKINEEYDSRKKERDWEFFKKKQELMQNGSDKLWEMKKEYSDDLHKKQMERMQKAYDLKLFQPKTYLINENAKDTNK
jgi:hypothetical protein